MSNPTVTRSQAPDMRADADALIALMAKWHNVDFESGRITLGSVASGATEAIQTASNLLEMDPTGFSTLLQAGAFLETSIAGAMVPLTELLAPSGRFCDRVAMATEVRRVLAQPHVTEQRDAFFARLAHAASYYAPDREAELQEFLADSDNAVMIRVAAQQSLRKGLRAVQLREGRPSGMTPSLYRHLHVCHSSSELVRALPALPASIGMVMFIDPKGEDYQTHFGLWVVDGERVFLFRDTDRGPHPLAAASRRRPERMLAKRIKENLFPYDVQGIVWDEREAAFTSEPSRSTELRVSSERHSDHLYPLLPLSELDPACLVWAALVFDLLKTKVFDEGFALPELSFAGSAVQITPGHGLIAPSQGQEVLPVPADMIDTRTQLTTADLHSRTGLRAMRRAREGAGDSSGMNDWLVDHFQSQIDQNLIDISPRYGIMPALAPPAAQTTPNDPERGQLLPHEAHGLQLLRVGRQLVLAEPSTSILDVVKVGRRAFKVCAKLAINDPDAIGTPAQLEADRYYLARHNEAVQVNLALQQAWAKQGEEAIAALHSRARSVYGQWLEEDLAAGERCATVYYGMMDALPDAHFPAGVISGRTNVLRCVPASTMEQSTQRGGKPYKVWADVLHTWGSRKAIPVALPNADGSYFPRSGGLRCVVADRPAAFAVSWQVNNWEGLCELLGWDKSDLPPLLRGWAAVNHYTGNSILDRVDPADHKIHHPLDRPIAFALPLSKHVFKQLSGRAEPEPYRYAVPKKVKLVSRVPGYVRQMMRERGFSWEG